MASLFEEIMQGGYIVPFGGLTESQQHCRTFTQTHLHALLHIRQREKFVREVRVCCCGYGPADEDEPMESSHFSQFQFYIPFTNDVIYFHDKFDFLILSIANGICKVEEGFEDRFLQALLDCMTFRDTTMPSAPARVLDLHTVVTPRIVGEVRRPYEETQLLIDSYVKQRHPFNDALRAELAQLEAEQYQVEKKRGEHESLMGWSRENSPDNADERGAYRAAVSDGTENGQTSSSADAMRQLNAHEQNKDASRATPSPTSQKPKQQQQPFKEGEDASITRLRAEIALANAEAEGEVEQQQKQNQQSQEPMPLLNMLLRVQEEQIRLEQEEKHLGVGEAPTIADEEL